MATRTSPLVSAVVLASTAAIAVATPAIVPSVHLPSPHALQAAKVQLATFADLLSITPAEWSSALFDGYGEAISPNQDPDFDWAAAYVSPFLGCDFNCRVPGVSGLAYLALDALINGNDSGYAPVLEDPTKPYNAETNPYVGGYPTWNVGAVNYFFEGGPGAGFTYLVEQPFGDPKSPLYNPGIAQFLATASQGLPALSNLYVTALSTLSVLALTLPVVGEYLYGGIQAYLGYPGYTQGLTGILQYVTNVITSGGAQPIPVPLTEPAASTLAAASVPAAAAALPPAATVETPKVEATPNDSKVSTPAIAEVSAPAVSETKASIPAVAEVSAPAVSETKASTPAPEVKPVEAPSVPDITPSTPAVDSDPAPVKDLGKEIAKAEAPASSAGTVSEPKADASDSKAGGSDTKVSAPAATSSTADATSGASETKTGASDAGGSDAGAGSASSDSAN